MLRAVAGPLSHCPDGCTWEYREEKAKMGRRLRWGVLSTANIGLVKVIPGIQRSSNGVVVALASRNVERGRIAAAKLGIDRVYGSYEALLNDPDVDAIYNPL